MELIEMQNQAQDAKVQWRDGKAFFASVQVNFCEGGRVY